MRTSNNTVEQRIREYEARLKHLDETPQSPEQSVSAPPRKAALPADWEQKRIRQSGPMGLWDALAQDLEHLLERWRL